MKQFRKILVATDTRLKDHPIVNEAAAIAKHSGAALKIVDVVPEFSWMVQLALPNHQHLRTLIRQEKEAALESLAEPLRAKGLTVETAVLLGKSSVELIKEVEEQGFDLVMRVAKGTDSRRSGFFGNTALQLLRKCPSAVWLVTPNTTPRFEHVLGCVDTSSADPLDAELSERVFDLAQSVSEYGNGRFSIVHAWTIYGEQMFRSRMTEEEFADFEKNSQAHVEKQLDTFLKKHGTSVDAENVYLFKGEPQYVISEFVAANNVDLVVMGTVARSGLAGMMMGNTAEMILSRLECSVLAVKPTQIASEL